jgi:phage gp29-like protein
MAETVYTLRRNEPEERGKVRPQGAQRYMRTTFNGIKPARVSRIISDLEGGRTEDWADLCDFILRDPHVRSVETTRMSAIIGAEIVVEPGVAREGEEEVAEQAAQDFREELDQTRQLESVLTPLLHAENVGWAGAEHDWKRVGGRWHSDPMPLAKRDIAFRDDWVPVVRSYPDRFTPVHISADDHPASRWMWHVPAKLSGTPTTSGDFLAIVWHWLFKRWAVLFRNEGLEAFANPFRVGKVAPGSPLEVRQTLEQAFENQSNNHWLIVEEGTDVELLQPAGTAGQAWNEAIQQLHDEITKAQLGSTLNTEVGTTGGNRALGESQAKNTMLPRLSAMAHRLESTLEEQWARPFLRHNAMLYGGRVPPTPRVRFQLVNDEPKPIEETAILAGAVTVDEVRATYGLPAWGPEMGGDRVARIASEPVAAPQSPAQSSAGGLGDPAPLSRRRPARRPTTAATSATWSGSRTQIAGMPYAASGDPEP